MTEAKTKKRQPFRKGSIAKPQAAPPPPKPGFDALVELHRDRILEMESRSYLPNQIAAVIRAPYKVVEHILTHKATPKRRTP